MVEKPGFLGLIENGARSDTRERSSQLLHGLLYLVSQERNSLVSQMNLRNISFSHLELPKNWALVPLNKLCIQDRKIVQPGSHTSISLPYLSMEHIESQTGRILRTSFDLVEDEGKSITFAFDPRHILYGKLRPYLNKVALPDFCGRCTTELIPLLPYPNVSRRYLVWLLRRPETVEFAMKETTGSRMPRANTDKLLLLQVPVPNSLEKQDQLADAMDEQMKSIERAKNACLEQLTLIDKLSVKLLSDFPLII